MTHKSSKMITALLLAMLFMLQGILFGFADFSDVQNDESLIKYINITDTSCLCTISGITATSKASMICKTSCNMNIKMELQKLQSGSYSTVKTWTESKTGMSLSMTKTKLINILSTYRLKATFTAGSETVTAYAYP